MSDEAQVVKIAIDKIAPGKYQPRRYFDPIALEELMQSITAQGLILPIVIRPVENYSRFEIVAGERRWRAHKNLKLDSIDCIVKEISDKDAALLAISENINREKLTPLEEAEYLYETFDLIELSKAEIGRKIGKSRAWVSNLLRLNECPDEIKAMIRARTLPHTQARALLSLDPRTQVEIAEKIIEQDWSVAKTEKHVKALATPKAKTQPPAKKDINIVNLETKISEMINAPIDLLYKDDGSGAITINYFSQNELDGIARRLLGKN